MDSASVRVVYDGEALRDGSMEVRDLAPALMALSDLIDEASRLLDPDATPIQIRAKRDIEAGSFDIGIEVVRSWPSKILDLFAGPQISGLANLLGILGLSATGATVGLLGLVKWLRGRKVRRFEYVNTDGVRLYLEDEQIVISRSIASVLGDLKVRRQLAKMLDPLRRDGIESFEVRRTDGTTIERIERHDLPSFDVPDPVDAPAEPLTETEYEQAYTLVSVTFREGNKWRVFDGQNTIGVTIIDHDFLSRVDRHEESFTKDDVLRCTVKQKQIMGAGGLKAETTVVKVLEHRQSPRQVVIAFDPPKDSGEGNSGGDGP